MSGSVKNSELLFFLGLSVGANILQYFRNIDYKRQSNEWKRKYELSADSSQNWHVRYSEYFHKFHTAQEKLKELTKIED